MGHAMTLCGHLGLAGGFRPLHRASYGGDTRMTRMLLEAGASANTPDKRMSTPAPSPATHVPFPPHTSSNRSGWRVNVRRW